MAIQSHDRLSTREFKQLSSFINDKAGIHVANTKKVMLESRLRKRLRACGMSTFREYIEYIHTREGWDHESIDFIDVVTTHKTDFWREPHHFELMEHRILHDMYSDVHTHGNRRMNFWSAACSRGDEPYTLAMVIRNFQEQHPHMRFDFKILATDISSRMVEYSKRAVYSKEIIDPIPLNFRKRFLLRSKDRELQQFRIHPEIRSKVFFMVKNLMDTAYGFADPMDVVFVRNVMIYFDQNTQKEIIMRICRNIRPGGYLFMGHSEVLDTSYYPIRAIAPTVYQLVS